MNVVIGVDPDSKAHGIAEYRDGTLIHLHMVTTVDLVLYLADLKRHASGLLCVIEDVKSQNFIYARNASKNKNVHAAVARKLGQNQQAQIELMGWLDHYGIKYKLVKPTRSNWAKDKSRFERLTGWTKRSNEDTRSAAYFGFLLAAE